MNGDHYKLTFAALFAVGCVVATLIGSNQREEVIHSSPAATPPRRAARVFTEPAQPTLTWHDNYADAAKAAAETGRPMLLYYTADWCLPCREVSEMLKTRRVNEARARFEPARIDYNKFARLRRDTAGPLRMPNWFLWHDKYGNVLPRKQPIPFECVFHLPTNKYTHVSLPPVVRGEEERGRREYIEALNQAYQEVTR